MRPSQGSLPLLQPQQADANAKLINRLRERVGDNLPALATAALGAFSRLVPPEDFAEVIMAAQLSVLVMNGDGKVLELLKAEAEKRTT